MIRERLIPEKKMRDSGPEFYQSHVETTSRLTNRVDFGRKYEFKPDKNPAPG